MTGKEFLKRITSSRTDPIRQVLRLLKSVSARYCVIGGLAVNAYVEPVVSLDLDLVVDAAAVERFVEAGKATYTTRRFPNSINLRDPCSDLRIQVQTDPRYQEFIPRARTRTVLGHRMKVATLEDVMQDKIWACSDPQRRGSKRQKDLADIVRLTEAYPHLARMLPDSIRSRLF